MLKKKRYHIDVKWVLNISNIWTWLLTWSPAGETSVSWKRNVSRAFQSYIPIEGANLLGENHSRDIPFPHIADPLPFWKGRKFRTLLQVTYLKNRSSRHQLQTMRRIPSYFDFYTDRNSQGMFDNFLITQIIKRMVKRQREKSRRAMSLAGMFRFNDASTAHQTQREPFTFGRRIIFFFAGNGKWRSCFPCINVNELWTPIQCTSVARNMAVSRFGRVAIGARVVNAVEQIDGGDKGETVAWHRMTVKRYN